MSGKKVAIGLVAGVVIVVALIMVVVMSFYSNNPSQEASQGSMEMTGFIIAMEDERVLVVSGEKEQVEGLTNATILDSRLPAVWFQLTIDQRNVVQLGDEVRVTHEGIEESYPGQSSAVTVEVIE